MGLDEDLLTGRHVVTGDVSLLMNPARLRIFQYVCNHPCSHLRDISRKLDISLQTARWHLSKLSEGGLVGADATGKKTLFFPESQLIGERECQIFSLLHRKYVLDVFLYIKRHPRSTQGELSRTLDIYQQKLSMILVAMEKAEMIGHEKKGREKAYSATDGIDEIVHRLDNNTNRFGKWLIQVLTKDGLNPVITESNKEVIIIQLDFGVEEKPVLSVYKNPLAAMLEGEIQKPTP
jgi:DNA-binding MarR family transcriptional regulator